jgi:hypothetical protein
MALGPVELRKVYVLQDSLLDIIMLIRTMNSKVQAVSITMEMSIGLLPTLAMEIKMKMREIVLQVHILVIRVKVDRV